MFFSNLFCFRTEEYSADFGSESGMQEENEQNAASRNTRDIIFTDSFGDKMVRGPAMLVT